MTHTWGPPGSSVGGLRPVEGESPEVPVGTSFESEPLWPSPSASLGLPGEPPFHLGGFS